jgi:dipeptidyl-peptidase-4
MNCVVRIKMNSLFSHFMISKSGFMLLLCLAFSVLAGFSQQTADPRLLTIDRIFNSQEFGKQYAPEIQWIHGGDSYIVNEPSVVNIGWSDLVKYETASRKRSIYVAAEQLIPEGDNSPLDMESFTFSPDESKVLVFTNSSRVWRSNSKGDYWIYDLATKRLKKIGARFPSSSLMFAKFSNDNRFVAFVQGFNIYVEDFQTGETRQLTSDGTATMINGTFDWVYEEEFGCRDGFRWSITADYIAFWHMDASTTGIYYMLNTTDSVYSRPIPIQYPKVGQPPSATRVGVIHVSDGKILWIPVPGGETENYLPRMQWINDRQLLIQQVNRKQDTLKFFVYDVSQGTIRKIYEEENAAWVDITVSDISSDAWEMEDLPVADKGQAVLRMAEIGDWRHLYKINLSTGKATDLTPGKYDVARYYTTSEKYAYFNASPRNSTQRYLYRVSLSGKGDTMRLTPREMSGMNTYDISPDSRFAVHTWSDSETPLVVNLVSLPDHKIINKLVDNAALKNSLAALKPVYTSFFTVTTVDGISMDGKMIRPPDFSPDKKYPVLFYVYGEPWEQVATDKMSSLWHTLLAQQGYVVIAIDNRGTPCLKGNEWRKSIYKKLGIVNARDQAMAAREVMKWSFVDTSRIAVWGWSGGGSMTLNLMFRFPSIYKTGLSVAAVSNQLTYDNIYTERYMGLPAENPEEYRESSPITYAKNLKGNLLIVHGTGDDNVHYQNMELLINELVRQNKQFTMMAYPNRSHGIYEGRNTTVHLYTLLTNYLVKNCPPGGR